MKLGSLCTGYGGLDLAAEAVLGPLEHTWHAEIDPHASQVLAHHWPTTPNLGDLTTVDWTTVPTVDVLTAGFPCQDVSAAGKGAGLKPGTRTGIWSQIAYGISILRPRLVLLENVEGLLSARAHSDVEPCPWCLGDVPPDLVVRALGAVLGDLAELGFDAEWATVSAADVGAPHRRRRVFIAAWPAADAPRLGHRDARQARVGGIPAAAVAGAAGAGAGGVTLLPTPRTSDTNGGGAHGTGGLDLRTAVSLLPTPTASEGERQSVTYARGNPTLIGALLPTPRASDTGTAGRRASEGFRPPLSEVLPTQLLPTPAARDWRSGESNIMDRNARPLNEVIVNLLPTPTAARYGNNQSASDGAAVRPSLDSLAGMDRWGTYAPAINRWELAIGRPAPDPTEPGTKGQPRLAPAFVEWLMGLPAGWVTDHLPRNAALKCLGNGVVPQQAAHAYAELLGGAA